MIFILALIALVAAVHALERQGHMIEEIRELNQKLTEEFNDRIEQSRTADYISHRKYSDRMGHQARPYHENAEISS